MPEVSTWTASVFEVVEELKVDPREMLGCQDLMDLLHVARRRVQQVMNLAGGEVVGKRLMISRLNLITYFEVSCHRLLEQEYARRRRLAGKLTAMRSQHIRQPKLLVELNTQECEQIYRRGLDTLPGGIRLEPGRIVVEGFSTGDEAKRMLMRLALAMATDEAVFDRIVEMKAIPDSPVHPTPTPAVPRGTGVAEEPAGEVAAI